MKKMFGTVLVGLGLLVVSPHLWIVTGVGKAAAQECSEARVTLRVDGMTCASCAAAVRTALRRLDGVSDATVSFDEERARVVYDPRRVTPERMVEAVNGLGYRARVEKED